MMQDETIPPPHAPGLRRPPPWISGRSRRPRREHELLPRAVLWNPAGLASVRSAGPRLAAAARAAGGASSPVRWTALRAPDPKSIGRCSLTLNLCFTCRLKYDPSLIVDPVVSSAYTGKQRVHFHKKKRVSRTRVSGRGGARGQVRRGRGRARGPPQGDRGPHEFACFFHIVFSLTLV